MIGLKAEFDVREDFVLIGVGRWSDVNDRFIVHGGDARAWIEWPNVLHDEPRFRIMCSSINMDVSAEGEYIARMGALRDAGKLAEKAKWFYESGMSFEATVGALRGLAIQFGNEIVGE